MFLIDDTLRWSASDLTAAADCEFALLRTLDYKLGRAERIEAADDPLQLHIAALGVRHEQRLLAQLERDGSVIEIAPVPTPYTMARLTDAAEATRAAFLGEPDVVYQAAFLDDEFFGYADFVERAGDGWLVCDAKLARHAKPKALLQLGAYAEQIRKLGFPISSTVSLLLGSGERADFAVADVLPVFHERRDALRTLLARHLGGGMPVEWNDDSVIACGRCAECAAAAERTDDVVLVAGMRVDHRRKLRAGGIGTLEDLASAKAGVEEIPDGVFDKLRRQASLQWRQRLAGEGAPLLYELTPAAPATLRVLPGPSEGDLFFDFEGDPLYDEGDPARTGLEYLWGVLGADGEYEPIWAHDWAQERAALVAFIDLVAARRAAHPDMHVYHYAPYETSALKRLAMRYQTKEKELDDLLRSEVFVDLYAVVRGAVRVGAGSYSIKKLEPLYMGDELRSDDEGAVAEGGASVVAYHEYRALTETDAEAAARRLDALADYNRYDCRSTQRLRDWLLDRAVDAGVRDEIVPRERAEEGEELSDRDPVFVELMARSGPESRADRTPDQQAYAMLSTAIDYYRRERKQYWWDHFERLHLPVEDWARARDVFIVERADVVQEWAEPEGRARNLRRIVRLVGDWSPGSKDSAVVQVVYAVPGPDDLFGPEGAPHGACDCEGFENDPDDPRVVYLTESCQPDKSFDHLPIALVPASPPPTGDIEAAIKEVASVAASATQLPECAELDVLARRPPRLRNGGPLPATDLAIDDVVSALVAMDDSYIAIQGPPGTGKTFTGARVIRRLVEEHHWRIGVVAQSHAVVENMLAETVKAGLDPELVGKNANAATEPTWTVIPKGVPARAAFLEEHRESGCVLGGTAWTFANSRMIDRRGLDLLVIDEAGQFSLAPTIGVAVSAQRLLLLGDPQQLPQVTQGVHAEPVDSSALGWLLGEDDTMPRELGYFLAASYRMHPALCRRVSVLSYEGRLASADEAEARRLGGVDPGLLVVAVEHTGNRTDSPEEAAEVVAQVRAHLGRAWFDPRDPCTPRPLGQPDVLVVAPYNAQVVLIRRVLDRAGLHDVRVGTVDKFQGQEAPVAIVSMTASSHGDVPRGMGFLLSRNRINVAVSRAQWRAILIRSQALTSYMPRSAHGLLELGAFIGLCATSDEGRPAE